jgi:hypothetical protein
MIWVVTPCRSEITGRFRRKYRFHFLAELQRVSNVNFKFFRKIAALAFCIDLNTNTHYTGSHNGDCEQYSLLGCDAV